MTAALRAQSSDFARVDLERDPDLALDPRISAMVLFCGMLDGVFTGKRLASYIHPARPAVAPDYVVARRIVNRQDDAELIASYAFEAALVGALQGAPASDAPAAPERPSAVTPESAPAYPGVPDAGDGKRWWQSSTILSTLATGAAGIVAAVNTPWGAAAAVAIAGVVLVGGAWVIRERARVSRDWGI